MRPVLQPDRTLHPLVAAAVLGAVVALSLLWTQRGLHVSGVFALLCPPSAAPQLTADGGTICRFLGAGSRGWIGWMAAGVLLGGLLASLWRTRSLRAQVERGSGVAAGTRLRNAAAGGLVVGVGAAIAGGCTSSIGLTGSALLSLAAFAFLGAFFAGGFAARIFFGRFWHD